MERLQLLMMLRRLELVLVDGTATRQARRHLQLTRQQHTGQLQHLVLLVMMTDMNDFGMARPKGVGQG